MTALISIDPRRAGAGAARPRRWRDRADRLHGLASTILLGGIALLAIAWPGLGSLASPWGGAALLVGGALIGVPHGTSDFVVAHRALRPSLGRAWLPTFLVGYLAIVAAVMIGWAAAPLPTLVGFVLLSGLHFGLGDLPTGERRSGFALAVRAATPLLPLLLIDPPNVAGLVAALGGTREAAAAGTLEALRGPLLTAWGAAACCYVVAPLLPPARALARARRSRDAWEVGAIALAAVTLPPLLAFALYFCAVHAVRHMVGIADDHRPDDARRAAALAAAIVVPSASVCLAVLALSWDGMAGPLGTAAVLAWSIRLIAALTVPHMALEAWAARPPVQGRGGTPREAA